MFFLDLDGKLLSKELIINFNKVVTVDINEKLIFTENELFEFFQEVIEILNTNKFDKYYHLTTKKSFLVFLATFYWNKFTKNIDDFSIALLISIIFSSLFLSKVSKNSLFLLETLIKYTDELKIYKHSLLKYIDSQDLRGLLFWTSKELLNLNYDSIDIKQISYEYSPPKISLQWLKKYREKGEPIEFWFYNSFLGKGLFLIFYTPKCRYAACAGCNLPMLSSNNKLNSQAEIYKQVELIINDSISRGEQKLIKEIVISNNGNMFDLKTMPVLSLLYILDTCINKLINLKNIVIESRLEYLNECQLSSLKQTVDLHQKNIVLEVAVGLEIFDDYYRNGYYKKGLSLRKIEKSMVLFSKFGINVKFYMMFKSIPNLSLEESIADINNAIKYFVMLSKKYEAKINIHISPTYVATGTQLEKEFNAGNYAPPNIDDINELYEKLELYPYISYYISMNDEGLSSINIVDNYNKYLELKHKIDYFNIHQKRVT